MTGAGVRGARTPRGFAGLGLSYWKLWSASVVSNLGDGISVLAYPWLASLLTRDPVLIAGVAVAQRLPWLVVSLPAGVLVDRSDRRVLMATMNALRCAVTLAVAVAVVVESMSIPLLYLAVLVLGFAEVLYDNASQTIMPRLVPADRLERANGNLWGAEIVTNELVGPPLGGFLIAVAVSAPFFTDAATFGLSAVLIALIAGQHRAPAQSLDGAQPSMRSELVEGFGWLWRHGLLRLLAVLLGLQNLLTAATFAIVVLYAQEVLGLGARGYGFLLVAPAVGGILGSQLAPLITRRLGPGAALQVQLAVGGGITNLVIVLVANAWVMGAMLALGWFWGVVWNVITVSLRQTIIPDRLLGRVNSVYRFFGWGMMPLGSLLGGVLVAGSEPLVGRVLALRVPFGVAAVGYLILFAVALGRLSTNRIEHAKALNDSW